MKHRAQADADLRVHHAVQLALADPRPNPFYAAFAALWAGSHVPTDSEIKATWALVAEQLNAANRLRIEEQLRGSIPEDKGERRRLRAELRRGVLPPPWPAPAVAPVQAASERRELLESYTVDTDPQTFLRMHHEYEKARRAQRPVRYLVHRKGEPPTVELHPPPPLSPKPRRPGVGGAPRKLLPAEIRAFLKKHGPVGKGMTQAARASMDRTLRAACGRALQRVRDDDEEGKGVIAGLGVRRQLGGLQGALMKFPE